MSGAAPADPPSAAAQAVADAFARAKQMQAAARFVEAETLCADILAATPDHAGALHLLAICHFRQGRFAEGVALAERVLALEPGDAEVHNNLANGLKALGRLPEALAHYERAVSLRPTYLAAYNNLGSALKDAGRPDAALVCFERALALRPDDAATLYNRGNLLAFLGRRDEALASYDRAIAAAPQHVQLLANRGRLLQIMARHGEAAGSFSRALALAPDRADLMTARGNAYRDDHLFDRALADYGDALARCAGDPEVLFNRSILHLLRGDFAQGWREYEQRWRFDKFIARSSGSLPRRVIDRLQLAPERSAFVGRRCLVVGEQGVGDQVMFASVLADLRRDAAAVTCLCTGKLRGLFARSYPDIEFVDVDHAADGLCDAAEIVVAIGSLAHAYRQSAADIPGAAYLRPAPEKVAAWRQGLGADSGRPVIGLSWRGGTVETRGAGRSLGLEDLLPLLRAVEARFVSLQYGDVAAEIAAFNDRHGQDILCVPAGEIDQFDDLAPLVAATDGVLSVQTALIHLCGAIGQSCLTLVPRQPEWRYGLSGETMPWYASVRLLRQGADGDWTPLIAQAGESLRARLTGR